MLVQVSTPYEREVVCMAASDSLLAVGSQNHVSLVDSRVKACVSSFANAEHNHGELMISSYQLTLVARLQCHCKAMRSSDSKDFAIHQGSERLAYEIQIVQLQRTCFFCLNSLLEYSYSMSLSKVKTQPRCN